MEWVEAGPWSTSEDAAMRARREMPIESYAAERYRAVAKGSGDGGQASTSSTEAIAGSHSNQKSPVRNRVLSGLYHGKKSAKHYKKIKSSLTQLQNCLGRANDIVTHKALFADIIASRARGLTEEQSRHRAFAAGLIIGDQEAQLQQTA